MKYRIILIVTLLGALLSCEKEISTSQADKFLKNYGNYLSGEGSDVDVLSDGGYAICGTDSTADDGKRMVLIVTDSYGNMQSGFPKYFTKDGLESGANAVEAIKGGQGGYMLFGYVESLIEGTLDTQKDMFVVKVSTSGDELWQRTYGSIEDEVILHATQRISSGYMLAGYQVKDGNSDILVMGIEEEGDSIPLGLNYHNPYAENSAASYILNHGDSYLCVCTYDKLGEPGTDLLILNINEDMDVFPEILTDALDEVGMCAIEDNPDRFLILGNRMNVSGRMEMVIYLIETEGFNIIKSLQLATISQSNTDLTGRRFVKTEDGRYAILGTRRISGSSEIFLQFLTSDYLVSGNVAFGASGTQTGADIEISEDGGMVLLGTNGYKKHSMISLIKTSDTGDL
jgi:hypothetical protein